MSVSADVCRLPGPVLVVLRDAKGQLSYKFASTVYQARQEARRAGAVAISDAGWDDLPLPGSGAIE